MLLVVTGAGASYDSAPSYRIPQKFPVSELDRIHQIEESRPPLSNGLFENRRFFAAALKKFHRCQPLVPHLRHLPAGRSLEQVLAAYLSEAETYPERHSQIMAVRYYIAYVLKACEQQWEDVHDGVTNYKTLLDQIERWRYESGEEVCLVTFNYDTMLDKACADVGLRPRGLAEYVSGKNYKLFKLHGSINWGRSLKLPLDILPDMEPQALADQIIARAADLKFYSAWGFVSQPPAPNYSTKLAECPAIAIPVENKSEFECPPGHVAALKQCLPRVTRMLTIGWRAMEEHFLKLLREHVSQPSLMVITGNQREAMGIANRLQPNRLDVACTTGGFTASILSGEIEQFLRKELPSPVLANRS